MKSLDFQNWELHQNALYEPNPNSYFIKKIVFDILYAIVIFTNFGSHFGCHIATDRRSILGPNENLRSASTRNRTWDLSVKRRAR